MSRCVLTVLVHAAPAPHSASVLNVVASACVVVFIGCARIHGCIAVQVDSCMHVPTACLMLLHVACICRIVARSRLCCRRPLRRGASLPRRRRRAAAHVVDGEEHPQRPPAAAGCCSSRCTGAVDDDDDDDDGGGDDDDDDDDDHEEAEPALGASAGTGCRSPALS